jgi:hypothetical protein
MVQNKTFLKQISLDTLKSLQKNIIADTQPIIACTKLSDIPRNITESAYFDLKTI